MNKHDIKTRSASLYGEQVAGVYIDEDGDIIVDIDTESAYPDTESAYPDIDTESAYPLIFN